MLTYDLETDIRFQQGIEKGIEKGRLEGIEQGIEKGSNSIINFKYTHCHHCQNF